ncbi:site-specific integrase [Stappia sp. F7233]|uniref:Site-specific integrase n=1 Tax=Stappia albiluteola TaxID=2758565 RepID=A0A839AEN2_9HYPH|nr:site-specific integrase [Stappia albiluteola]MBA5778041.1 site-specific integrase [Stappia albiluteola]
MPNSRSENVRLKRRYYEYLKHAKGLSEKSIDQAAAAIDEFETFNGKKPFSVFHVQHATNYKTQLLEGSNSDTGKVLSLATVRARLKAVQAFFVWLADQSGYRSRIRYCDAEYFTLTARDERIATAPRKKPVPEISQVERCVDVMPYSTAIEKRDRAMIAFIAITGIRDGAVASLKLKHVDLKAGVVFQDPREVKTKFAKTITTAFFPVSDKLEAIVREWVEFLTNDLHFGPDDPLFPRTRMKHVKGKGLQAIGLDRACWSSANRIRQIFSAAFQNAALPPFNPHAFRNMLVRIGMERCKGPEAFKAWSQNLGHEGVITTFSSYGNIPDHQQVEIIRKLASTMGPNDALEQCLQAALDAVQRR